MVNCWGCIEREYLKGVEKLKYWTEFVKWVTKFHPEIMNEYETNIRKHSKQDSR